MQQCHVPDDVEALVLLEDAVEAKDEIIMDPLLPLSSILHSLKAMIMDHPAVSGIMTFLMLRHS